jgi:phosphotransferase system IIA component
MNAVEVIQRYICTHFGVYTTSLDGSLFNSVNEIEREIKIMNSTTRD